MSEKTEQTSLIDDVKVLKNYLDGHFDRLNLDIDNARKDRKYSKVHFYEGAQGATNLFRVLLDDLVTKHTETEEGL